MDRETWGVTPPIEIDPLCGLLIHCLEAWAGLGVGRRPIPSLQMEERLLDVPPGKFVGYCLSYLFRLRVPVRTKTLLNLPLHHASFVAGVLHGSAE
jgi:hypothetical protein